MAIKIVFQKVVNITICGLVRINRNLRMIECVFDYYFVFYHSLYLRIPNNFRMMVLKSVVLNGSEEDWYDLSI